MGKNDLDLSTAAEKARDVWFAAFQHGVTDIEATSHAALSAALPHILDALAEEVRSEAAVLPAWDPKSERSNTLYTYLLAKAEEARA